MVYEGVSAAHKEKHTANVSQFLKEAKLKDFKNAKNENYYFLKSK